MSATKSMPVERSWTTPARIVAGVAATVLGLVLGAFCMAVARFFTYGFDNSADPSLDGLWLPLLGVATAFPLGPLVLSVLSTKGHGLRWLIVAAVVSVLGVLVASLITWIPATLGWRQ